MAVMEEDFPRAIILLTEIQQQAKDFTQHIGGLLHNAKNGNFSTSKGVSFLEVKYQSLLSYLMNLTCLMAEKTSGFSVHGNAAIDRLVEIRTVLEKMRPIDQKLKYQIEKLVKTAVTGASDLSDPLRHKPQPGQLVSKIGDGDTESGSEDEKQNKTRLYMPPKIVAMHYDEDDTLNREEKKQNERKRRVLNSTMMQDLKDEYFEGPQEIRESRDLHRLRANKKAMARKEYEEEHFVRLSVSKKERNAAKKMMTISALDGLTQFDDVSALMGEDGYEKDTGCGKKRKLGKKIKRGKNGFKKRRTV